MEGFKHGWALTPRPAREGQSMGTNPGFAGKKNAKKRNEKGCSQASKGGGCTLR